MRVPSDEERCWDWDCGDGRASGMCEEKVGDVTECSEGVLEASKGYDESSVWMVGGWKVPLEELERVGARGRPEVEGSGAVFRWGLL